MRISAKTRWSLGLVGLAVAFLLAFYVLPAVSSSSEEASGSGKCIQPQQKLVDSGLNPSGDPWTVTASVRKNHGCDSWLFESKFVPAGKVPGSFAFGWGIPAGGHLSDGFTIGARDESSNSERVLGGMVGGRVARIVVQMSSGGPLTIQPKLPAKKLREKFVWLRNVRYAMRFYPAGSHATKVTLYTADGKVVERVSAIEGAFTGPSV
jgi:hypothetical protein